MSDNIDPKSTGKQKDEHGNKDHPEKNVQTALSLLSRNLSTSFKSNRLTLAEQPTTYHFPTTTQELSSLLHHFQTTLPCLIVTKLSLKVKITAAIRSLEYQSALLTRSSILSWHKFMDWFQRNKRKTVKSTFPRIILFWEVEKEKLMNHDLSHINPLLRAVKQAIECCAKKIEVVLSPNLTTLLEEIL